MTITLFPRETLVPPDRLAQTLVELIGAGAVVMAVRFGPNVATIVIERRARRARVPVPGDRRTY